MEETISFHYDTIDARKFGARDQKIKIQGNKTKNITSGLICRLVPELFSVDSGNGLLFTADGYFPRGKKSRSLDAKRQ